ncbi:MAG: F0F1 ATP synthase subunit alpha, partial [Dehalococcoidia bacterium]
ELDAATRHQLERGQRLTEVLKQLQFQPLTPGQEVSILYAGVNGYLDDVELGKVHAFEEAFANHMQGSHPDTLKEIDEKKELTPEIEKKLKTAVEQFKESVPY